MLVSPSCRHMTPWLHWACFVTQIMLYLVQSSSLVVQIGHLAVNQRIVTILPEATSEADCEAGVLECSLRPIIMMVCT